MADPSDAADAHASRRERRSHRSRRRWRHVATAIACVAILVGFGLVITETVRLGGSDRPSLARVVDAAPSATSARTSTTSPTIPGRPCRAPLDDADPLRLWIGGDSLAGSLGPALGTIAGATGVVQPQFDSRVSSGLTNPTFFDWPEHAAQEMQRLDPEIAVFIVGANDFNAPSNGAKSSDDEEPAWRVEYAALIEQMLSALDTGARTVVWIGSPAFKDEERDDAIRAIDDLAKEVLANHPQAAYVDAYSLFTDADGQYAAALPPLDAPDADPVPVRAGDGVHFTSQGADRLAQAVFALVDAQCRVTAQAIPGVVKGTIQTEGSTLVVGGTARGGTVQTSPPATSPPATSPPTTAPPATSPPTTTAPPATTAPPVTTAPPPTST
jgi:hypothetical protein